MLPCGGGSRSTLSRVLRMRPHCEAHTSAMRSFFSAWELRPTALLTHISLSPLTNITQTIMDNSTVNPLNKTLTEALTLIERSITLQSMEVDIEDLAAPCPIGLYATVKLEDEIISYRHRYICPQRCRFGSAGVCGPNRDFLLATLLLGSEPVEDLRCCWPVPRPSSICKASWSKLRPRQAPKLTSQ